ncbi:hypothetical protein [Candidatus Pelagibacter sp.]|uniref:hypothetical protein n=1 Tax=Candidatus Pelagibacter sp. TaxID=2024849 RepID=UPI003F87788D
MDEETALIDANTRNEKIKNFLVNNKSRILTIIISIVVLLLLFFGYGEYKKRDRISVSDEFNSLTIGYNKENNSKILTGLINVIKEKNPTYSPLALYFIIDNGLIEDKGQINQYFDILINHTPLDDEIENLVIYKKALFNADNIEEAELLEILKPINNSNSVWKSHSLYLLGEYFYSKGEKQKAKEFFDQISNLENANPDIRIQTEKRLRRDLSD